MTNHISYYNYGSDGSQLLEIGQNLFIMGTNNEIVYKIKRLKYLTSALMVKRIEWPISEQMFILMKTRVINTLCKYWAKSNKTWFAQELKQHSLLFAWNDLWTVRQPMYRCWEDEYSSRKRANSSWFSHHEKNSPN